MKIVMAYFEALAGISGGLERILCNFSNEMAARGHQVWVIYNDGSPGAPFYPLRKEVQLINLRSMTTVKSQLTVAEKIHREWCRLLRGKKGVHEWKAKCRNGYIARLLPGILDSIHPDVIISYNHETSGQLFHAGIRSIPLITMFHNDPDALCAGMTNMERKGIAHSDLIQVLTPDQKRKAIQYFPKDRIICIPNEVPQISMMRGGENKRGFCIIDVARLNKKQKRQHLLIEAFARIVDQYPGWRVELWGQKEYPYTKFIEKRIMELHVEKQILLKGTTHDVVSIYQYADIFALPSVFEGFPLAVTEAMSAGIPVVAYQSCTGVNEIVRHGYNGLLAKDGVDSFAAMLKQLMDHPEERSQMGEAARESMQVYAPHKIYDQWEGYLKQVTLL